MKRTEEIEKTLNSLDHLKRATAPDSLGQELFGKLRFIGDPWYRGLKYGVAAMIILTGINGYLLLRESAIYEERQVEYLAEELFDDAYLIDDINEVN